MSTLSKTIERIKQGVERGLHPGAQVAVWHAGAWVARHAVGRARPEGYGDTAMDLSTRTLWMSAGKPIVAVALARQIEAGAVELDDPVVEYLPEFGVNGKEAVTLGDVLTHRGGFRSVVSRYPEETWDQAVAAACAARLETGWEVGRTAGYHPHSGWAVLGRVLEVCSGQPLREHLCDTVLEPWGMRRTCVGMLPETYDRVGRELSVMVDTARGGEHAKPVGCHERAWATGQRPGGNVYGPAEELVRFYAGLLAGGELDGVRLLRPETVARFTARVRRDTEDRTFRAVMDWGLGIMVNNRRHDAANAERHPAERGGTPYGFGPHASDDAYGHGGNQSSMGFADPRHDLAVAVVFNGMPGESAHQSRMHAVLGAIYEDLGLAPAE
ncbi:MAG: serine hydrolase domain-containing protein [Planctomycetota bacterium]